MITNALPALGKDSILFGNTKVFMRNKAFMMIEKKFEEKVIEIILFLNLTNDFIYLYSFFYIIRLPLKIYVQIKFKELLIVFSK